LFSMASVQFIFKPTADQGRFSVTGRCSPNGQRWLAADVKLFKQPRSSHQVLGNSGPVEFGADEGKYIYFV